MISRARHSSRRSRVYRLHVAILAIAIALFQQHVSHANDTPQSLPFSQDWSNINLITADDDWSGVAGIVGFRGDGLAGATGVNPQTIGAESTVVDVIANQTNPNTATAGGVAEFHTPNPTIALQGSGTARAPYVQISVSTIGASNINISYNLRDIDGSADNSIQAVALQYRVGSSGNFINLPAGFVADATTGPSLATLVTPVSVTVGGADNQPLVQFRIITTDAVGSDEWVGIDDIAITGSQIPISTSPTGAGLATPSNVLRGAQSLLTVSVMPGQNPASTNLTVAADLSSIGGMSNQQFYDDGSNGDVIAGDGVFSYLATTNSITSLGVHLIPFTITDAQARTGTGSISLTVHTNDKTPVPLPFTQNWSDTSQITIDDIWSGVPGIVGYRGDNLTSATGVDPQTLLAPGTEVFDVIANQTNPNTLATGGVAEFEIADPTIALQGSGTADAPFILVNLNTLGASGINVAYNLRDIDGSNDNAAQPVALQFRVGNVGDFTNVPAAYVADATTGPSLATLVTPVSVVLPSAADNQPLVQLRIITANAVGNDEWVGIDDISITAPQGQLSAVGQASPSTVFTGGTTLLTVSVTPGSNPPSTDIIVTADLSMIGGSASQPLFDDGVSGGDVTAGDNVFTFSATVDVATTPGIKQIPVNVADAEQRFAATTLALTVVSPTAPSVVGLASPSKVDIGAQTLLTAAVIPGTNPASTDIHVIGDLSAIGGSAAQQLLDDGLNGDAAAGDNLFSFRATIAPGTTPGLKSLPLVVTDAQARSGFGSISLAAEETPLIAISQIYGGGGNSGAPLRNDFIELINRGTSPVDLAGWSVQYASSSGSTWQVTTLTGSIAPGGYYLIQQNSGGVNGVNLPIADAIGTISMAAGAGKIALLRMSAAIAPGINCPVTAATPSLMDFVGYGAAADCFEGAGRADTPSNTLAALRLSNGCVDTNDNDADFFTGSPTPRNTQSPATDCTTPPPPPPQVRAINEIQGYGGTTPFVDQIVATPISIVTAVKSNGFFIQTPDGHEDADPETSEGIFVFTSSNPGAVAVRGNAVQVTGKVHEFIPSADPNSPSMTEISGPTVTLISTGNALPAPIVITAANTNPLGSMEQLERFEGMRVQVDSLTAISGTQGSINETNATSSSNGVFHAVVTGVPRPLREPGIELPDPLPPGAPANVPRFDGNPERLRVVSAGQVGGALLNVNAGDVVTGVTGVLDYGFRTYTILPDVLNPPAVIAGYSGAPPAPDPAANQFTVASANLERFFDTVNDPAKDDPVLTQTALNNRLNKVSLYIRKVMRTPDILGVVEVENLSVLQMIANKVNGDAVAAGDPNPNYDACLFEGNDIGGIDVGFLIKMSRVSVIDCTQFGKDATFIDPSDGSTDLLNDRPPLILRATIQSPSGNAFPITVIDNHLRSLSGVEDPGPTGTRVRRKRAAQAEALAAMIQERQAGNPNESIIAIGDFNAFEFNDGYADVIGTIKGTPAPPDQVMVASPDLVDPDLIDLVEQIPASERYSFSFDGNGQVLDHHIITQNLVGLFDSFTFARDNADFAEVLRNDPAGPERISDHDGAISYFNFPVATTTTVTSSLNPSMFGQSVTFAATVKTGAASVTTGEVVFSEGSTILAAVALNASGIATFTTSSLLAGVHDITAAFSGSGILEGSSGSVTQTVDTVTTTTTLKSSSNPSAFLSSVTFTATVGGVSGTVTEGSVTFRDGATVLATVQVNPSGVAAITTKDLSLGLHAITAEYSGSKDYAPSSANLSPDPNQNVLPGVVISDVTVTEGNVPASVAANFTVSLIPASTETVAVGFATANGTAISGIDYVSKSGNLIFPPGVTSQIVTIVINGDELNEQDEVFQVNLSGATNALITDGQGIATIMNDDPLPQMTINDIAVREANSGTVDATFTVRLSAPSAQTVMAQFSTADDSAVSPGDYLPNSGSILFSPGMVAQTISVSVNGDTLNEIDETFFVNLSSVTNAELSDGKGVATILNDDDIPRISIGNVTVTEPDSGSMPAVFAVSLSNPSQLPITVRFATANGVALAGSDYTATIGTLTFAPGQVTQTITVPVLADSAAETAEFFFVNLSAPTNAVISDGQGIGVIYDAAAPAITSFSPAAGAAGTTVLITGTDFTGVVAVRFGNAFAAFTVLSPTSIRATVPPTAVTGPISVVSLRGVGTSATSFTVLPRITAFTPTSGAVGTVVTITGSSFTDVTSVRFNGVDATFTPVSATTIHATVMPGSTTGPITVVTPAGPATSASNFRVLPKITSFTPSSGPVGTTVTISGSNLTGASVRFGAIAAVITATSYDHVAAVVPSTATTGRISVVTADGTAISATDFAVSPGITSFSPQQSAIGGTVTVTGTSFTGVTVVRVAGVAASFTVLSPTSLRLIVPATAVTGPISITTAGGTATSTDNLTILPRITSFSPRSAAPGTLITINGSGFGGATSVTFGTVSTTAFTVVSSTQIRATVPATAVTGKISVTTPGGTAVSATNFTVLHPA